MLTVGIFTQYRRCEQTLAAVQFADWLRKCGITVKMLTPTKVQKGVHAFWDNQIKKKSSEKTLYKWAYNCTHLMWFDPAVDLLQKSHLVTFNDKRRKTKNLFIPNWSNWDSRSDAFLAQADKILCLNRDLYLWLKTFRPNGKLLSPTRVYGTIPSPDVILTPKPALACPESKKLLVYLPKNIELDIPSTFIDCLGSALSSYPHLEITLLSDRALKSTFTRKIKKVLSSYPSRFSFAFSLPYWNYCQFAKKADWVYVANTRFSFGTTFNLFSASTTPFICHAIPPTSSFVNNKINGLWIDCKYLSKPYPIADVDSKEIEKKLNQAITMPKDEVLKLQLTSFSLFHQKQKAFERLLYSEIVEV